MQLKFLIDALQNIDFYLNLVQLYQTKLASSVFKFSNNHFRNNYKCWNKISWELWLAVLAMIRQFRICRQWALLVEVDRIDDC